jgi:hypothetical protein
MAGRITVSTLNNDTGPLATQNGMTGIPKAWVNFNGSSASIRGSFNVSSVTRNALGNYTVAFSTAMASVNYSCFASHAQNGNSNPAYVCVFQELYFTTSSLVLNMNGATGGSLDPSYVFISVIGS